MWVKSKTLSVAFGFIITSITMRYMGYEKVFNEHISSSILVSYEFATRSEEKMVKGWCIGACGELLPHILIPLYMITFCAAIR